MQACRSLGGKGQARYDAALQRCPKASGSQKMNLLANATATVLHSLIGSGAGRPN